MVLQLDRSFIAAAGPAWRVPCDRPAFEHGVVLHEHAVDEHGHVARIKAFAFLVDGAAEDDVIDLELDREAVRR